MRRSLDFDQWQELRRRILPLQVAILGRDGPPSDLEPPPQRPEVPRPLRSHRPRTDDEWDAVADGVRAVLAARVASGEWVWSGPRRLTII